MICTYGEVRRISGVLFFILLAMASTAIAQDLATLNGSYRVIGQDQGYYGGQGVTAEVYTTTGTMTFDGAGLCSFNLSGTGYSVFTPMPLAVNSVVEPSSGSCSYTVAADGAVQVTIDGSGELRNFRVSTDGSVIARGDVSSDDAGRAYSSSQMLAFRVGSGLTAADAAGVFHISQQDGALVTAGGGGGIDLYASMGTVTFDGVGGCKVSSSGFDFSLGLYAGAYVTAYSSSGNQTCTYSIASDGSGQLIFASDGSTHNFYLSADRNMVFVGSASINATSSYTSYNSQQMMGIRAGSTMNKGLFKGRYLMVDQEAGFWGSTSTIGSVVLSGATGTIVADGSGSCSFDYSGYDFILPFASNSPQVTASPYGGSGVPCSYSVSSSGAVTVTHPGGSEHYWLSADGRLLIGGGAKKVVESGSNIGFIADQWLAMQVDPYIGYLDALGGLTVPASDADGKFSVSWTPSAGEGVSYILQESTDPAFPEGTATRTVYKGTATSASVSVRVKPLTYYYRVKAVKTGYADSDWTAVQSCNAGMAALPSKIVVPANDVDGSYTVSWLPSGTAGVTYVLQEATDRDFTQNLREVYNGSATEASVSGNAGGVAYYYRIVVQKAGFADSTWKKAGGPCKVSPASPAGLTVPASSTDGSLTLSWPASTTPGVTYKVQESPLADFSSGTRSMPVKTGTTLLITGRKPGVYYYRIQTLKTGFQASAWTPGANSCTVQ